MSLVSSMWLDFNFFVQSDKIIFVFLTVILWCAWVWFSLHLSCSVLCRASWILAWFLFAIFGKFFTIISSDIASAPFSFFCPLGVPVHVLNPFTLSFYIFSCFLHFPSFLFWVSIWAFFSSSRISSVGPNLLLNFY